MFSNLNSNCSNLLDMRNLQEQAFCYQKLFWPFTVWINYSSDLKMFSNSWPSASNFKSFSRSIEQFFLTVGQNNFGSKILIPGKNLILFLFCLLKIWPNLGRYWSDWLCYFLQIDALIFSCIIFVLIWNEVQMNQSM